MTRTRLPGGQVGHANIPEGPFRDADRNFALSGGRTRRDPDRVHVPFASSYQSHHYHSTAAPSSSVLRLLAIGVCWPLGAGRGQAGQHPVAVFHSVIRRAEQRIRNGGLRLSVHIAPSHKLGTPRRDGCAGAMVPPPASCKTYQARGSRRQEICS